MYDSLDNSSKFVLKQLEIIYGVDTV